MYKIAIPVKNDTICPVKEAEHIALIDLNEGKIEKVTYLSYEEVLAESHFFIFNNRNESTYSMFEHSIEVLITPHELMTIDEIVEAFLFRELRDY